MAREDYLPDYLRGNRRDPLRYDVAVVIEDVFVYPRVDEPSERERELRGRHSKARHEQMTGVGDNRKM